MSSGGTALVHGLRASLVVLQALGQGRLLVRVGAMAPRCLVTLPLALFARLDVVVDAGRGVRRVGRAAQDVSSMVMVVSA